jgi:hypothetical protein
MSNVAVSRTTTVPARRLTVPRKLGDLHAAVMFGASFMQIYEATVIPKRLLRFAAK